MQPISKLAALFLVFFISVVPAVSAEDSFSKEVDESVMELNSAIRDAGSSMPENPFLPGKMAIEKVTEENDQIHEVIENGGDPFAPGVLKPKTWMTEALESYAQALSRHIKPVTRAMSKTKQKIELGVSTTRSGDIGTGAARNRASGISGLD